MQIKLIFIQRVEHQASFWKRGKGNSEIAMLRLLNNLELNIPPASS